MRALAAVVLFGLTLVVTRHPDAQTSPQLQDRITSSLRLAGLISKQFPVQCIGVSQLPKHTGEGTEYRVFEIHKGECRGDPETSPTMAFVRYDAATNRIFVFDMSAAEYQLLLEADDLPSDAAECRSRANAAFGTVRVKLEVMADCLEAHRLRHQGR